MRNASSKGQISSAFTTYPDTPYIVALFDDHSSPIIVAGTEQEKTSKLASALSALQAAACDYRQRRRRPAALVIDNAEQLARQEDVLRDILFTGDIPPLLWQLSSLLLLKKDDAIV